MTASAHSGHTRPSVQAASPLGLAGGVLCVPLASVRLGWVYLWLPPVADCEAGLGGCLLLVGFTCVTILIVSVTRCDVFEAVGRLLLRWGTPSSTAAHLVTCSQARSVTAMAKVSV
jgi:hypothetical protein